MSVKKLFEGKSLIWIALGLMLIVGWMAANQNASGAAMTSEEKRVAQVLSAIAGAGKVEVALFYTQPQDGYGAASSVPSGAVVVAQGAEDMAVRLSLIRAVRTLLSLPETAVDVFVMEDGR